MKVKVAREDTYIPKWRDNRKLPEVEQVKVHFKYMTAEQEERLSLIKPKYQGENIDLEVQMNSTVVWEECVTKIDNFTDDTGKPITPKAALDIPGIYSLVTEVVGYIRRNLEEEERKN